MVRSIPLSSITRNAWKDAGATFARRDSNPERIERIADGRPIINLGNSSINIDGAWNDAEVVRPLLTPFGIRARMSELLPSGTYLGVGTYWLKGEGRGGNNKELVAIGSLYDHDELKSRARWMNGDVQQHVGGIELRVITVGHKVVQVSRRTGPDSNRIYTWVGLRDTDAVVKDIARTATRKLRGTRTIVGWDIMQTNGHTAFILEGNSCPGVNEATANRILDEVERRGYDE